VTYPVVEATHGERESRNEHDHRSAWPKQGVSRPECINMVRDVLQHIERHERGVLTGRGVEDI